MDINIPYTYVHLSNQGTYLISVFAQTNPLSLLQLTDVPLGWAETVRKVVLQEGDIGSKEIDYWAEVSNARELEINVPLETTKGEGTWKTNTARLFTVDQESIAVERPTYKTHLPHLYLMSEKSKTIYTIYIAIQTRNGFTYGTPVIDTSDSKVRTITINERTAVGLGAEKWHWKSVPTTQLFDFTRVIVKDSMGAEKAKGTIRHSAADNKPFDLDDL
jgi:hypothetical protein